MKLSANDESQSSWLRRLATRHARGRKQQRPSGRLFQSMSAERRIKEHVAHVGGAAVSASNHDCGFRPAFRDLESGRVVLARFKDGSPAPMHVLEGLPEEWVLERDAAGAVVAVKSSVIAGFLREGRFCTREQAAAIAGEIKRGGGSSGR